MRTTRFYKLSWTVDISGIRTSHQRRYELDEYDEMAERFNAMKRNRKMFPTAGMYEVTQLA